MENKIFLSHRSTDKEIADMLLDFFVSFGINRDKIFCSSLPGNDVTKKISNEVKDALTNSCFNIAILSKDYQESPYCLNEAGILWFSETPVIVIAMPEITPQNMHMFGFLDDEYKLRRLNDDSDISAICSEVCQATNSPYPMPTIVLREAQKLIEKYNKYLETRENLTINQKSTSLQDIRSHSIPVEYDYSHHNAKESGEKIVELSEIFKYISIEMLGCCISESKIEEVLRSKLFEEYKDVQFKDSQIIKKVLNKLEALDLIVSSGSSGSTVYWKLTDHGDKLRKEIALGL